MKMLLAFLLALASLCSAQLVNNANLGVAVSVTGNTDFTINYLGGASLVIRVDQDAQVTLSAYVNVQADLPKGFQSLSFGAQIGFKVDVSPANAVVVDISLTTPALTVGAAALLTGSVEAGCLRYDSATQVYSYIEVPSYNAFDRTITIPLPGRGIYLFVAFQINANLPTFFNEPREVEANQELRLSFPGGLDLNLTVNANGNITVVGKDEPSNGAEMKGHVSIGKFFDISLDSSSASSNIEATLAFQYNQSDIDALGVTESSLRFAFYNEASGEWETPEGGSVDTENNIVFQTTTHFSEWAVYGSPASIAQVSAVMLLFLMAALLL